MQDAVIDEPLRDEEIGRRGDQSGGECDLGEAAEEGPPVDAVAVGEAQAEACDQDEASGGQHGEYAPEGHLHRSGRGNAEKLEVEGEVENGHRHQRHGAGDVEFFDPGGGRMVCDRELRRAGSNRQVARDAPLFHRPLDVAAVSGSFPFGRAAGAGMAGGRGKFDCKAGRSATIPSARHGTTRWREID